MEAAQREYRWRRMALLSAAIRLGLVGSPAAIAAGFGLLLLRYLPRASGHLNVATWLTLTVLLSLVVLLVFEVVASRFRALASLLDISMVHPHRPPTRVVVAMTSPYYLELTAELEGVRRHLRKARRDGEDATVAEHLDRVECILTLATLSTSLEPGTRRHSRRVAQLADRVALVMGLDRPHRRWLRWAALLHDVGKLAVPENILHKPATLDAAEREIVRRHVTDGVRIVAPLIPLLGPWARAVGEHHERWDGTGYPLGLKGEEISLAGRIVAVADTYATMTKGRIYRRRVTPAAGLRELQVNAGGQFDPAVVAAFAISWKARRSPAILLGLPRTAAVTVGSIWATLGLPAASAAAMMGIAGAVAVVAITAPAVARVLPAHGAGPIAGIENVLGVPAESAVPSPSPASASPSPTPPSHPVIVRISPVPANVATGVSVAAAAPPDIRLGSTTTAVEGVPMAIDGSVSSADGTVPTVTVDFGDGTPVQSVPLSRGSFHLTHAYVDEGNCSVVVTASNARGTTRAISQLTIAEYQATVNLPSAMDAPGGTFSLAGNLVDPSADTEFATVDYGDGTVQSLDVNGREFQLQHTYAQAADSPTSYTVQVTFRDDDGPGRIVTVAVSITPATS